MSGWSKSVFKSALKTGLKLVETIRKPIISKIFHLKEVKEIVNDPILDRDEKTNEIKKIIYGSKDDLENNYKPERFTSAFNSNYIEYRSNGDKDKILSIEEYLHEIKPHLADIINKHKNKDEWKIQISMSLNFVSSKDSNEVRTMYTKSDNVDVLISNTTDDIIKQPFECTLKRYQYGLE